MASKQDPQVNVRMPQVVLDAIRGSAAASGRTLTTEVSHLLNKALGNVAELAEDGRAYAPPRNKLSPAAAERVKLMARITGKAETDTLERMVLGYVPTPAEARAIAAIKSLDDEATAREPVPDLKPVPEPAIYRALERGERAKKLGKSAAVLPMKPKRR